MNLLSLPDGTENALQARGISKRGILAIRLVISCLDQVCDWVAQDTGSDRKDDATSRGGLRWRRARNFVVEVLEEGRVPELLGVHADTTDNALQIPVDGTRISFYAARDGIDFPDLSGPSKTKKVVVSEMQLQFGGDGMDVDAPPPRLVLLYDADQHGLRSAAIGKLLSEREWAEDWRFTAFERAEEVRAEDATSSELPNYDEQPEPKLPPLEALPSEGEDEDAVSGPSY